MRGVGQLVDSDRVLEQRVRYLSPKQAVPTVTITGGLETGKDIDIIEKTRFGFSVKVSEIGGPSGTDGFDCLGINWQAEVA